MANNRMWLVNEQTGEEVLLAKYYPSTGWYVANSTILIDHINAAFHKHDFGDVSYEDAQSQQLMARGGQWGDTSWCIRYESAGGVSNLPEAQAKIDIVEAMNGPGDI